MMLSELTRSEDYPLSSVRSKVGLSLARLSFLPRSKVIGYTAAPSTKLPSTLHPSLLLQPKSLLLKHKYDSLKLSLQKHLGCLCTCAQSLSHVHLSAAPWTVAHQAPLSMGFPRQEHWSVLPCPTTGNLPRPGIEPWSPALAGAFFTAEPSGKPMRWILYLIPSSCYK